MWGKEEKEKQMGAQEVMVGNRIRSPDKTARAHRTNAGTSAVSPFINTCGMSTRARLLLSVPHSRGVALGWRVDALGTRPSR